MILEIVEQNGNVTTFRALKAGMTELTFRADNGNEARKIIVITEKEEIQVPTEPATPTNPIQPEKSEVFKDSSVPKTGDVTNIGFLVLIMSASLFVMRRKLKG